MSIQARTRLASLTAALFAAVVLGAAVQGAHASHMASQAVAAANASRRHQAIEDDRFIALRAAVIGVTRAADRGAVVSPSEWRSLEDKLTAFESEKTPRRHVGPARARLAVMETAHALIAAAKAGVVRPDLIARFCTSLQHFQDTRLSIHRGLTDQAEASIRSSLDIFRMWNWLLVAGAALATALQLAFGSWIRKSVTAPLAQLVSALGSEEFEQPAASSAARDDEIGALTKAVLAYRQLTVERTEAARQLAHVLRHDALTGLLGRQAFDEILAAALADEGSSEIALFTLGLDRFKDINDTSGHVGGDAVLRRAARILVQVCDNGEIIGRLGGDEFAIVRFGTREADGARRLADRLLTAFQAEGIGVSIGAALYPQDAAEETRLRHYSDLALFRAKHDGRGRVSFFGAGQQVPNAGRAASFVPLPSELRDAIAADQLLLHYQPKIRARTCEIDSVEALVRWQHPTRGLVAPDVFIPVAEKMGQIRALTDWTLRRAIADRDRLARAGRSPIVYVNISACLLGDPDFAHSALDMVKHRPGSIGFEVTETAVIDDPHNALAHLQQFVDAGVRIAIDDYGAGMSSLSYLKRLPAHELKIDRAFVAELSRSQRDPLIVRSTIDLAHALGLEVTAEGVEKFSAFALLRAMGCDLIQGYLVARPMPIDDLLAFLADENALAHLGAGEIDARATAG